MSEKVFFKVCNDNLSFVLFFSFPAIIVQYVQQLEHMLAHSAHLL